MSAGTTDPDPAWNDALLAASVLAVDAAGVGGIVVKARAGSVRDRWLELLRNRLPPGMALRRVPGHVDD
jgi:magnesium chelatase subunit D